MRAVLVDLLDDAEKYVRVRIGLDGAVLGNGLDLEIDVAGVCNPSFVRRYGHAITEHLSKYSCDVRV